MHQNEWLETPSEIEEPEKTYSIIDIYGNESWLHAFNQYDLNDSNLLWEVNESQLVSLNASPESNHKDKESSSAKKNTKAPFNYLVSEQIETTIKVPDEAESQGSPLKNSEH